MPVSVFQRDVLDLLYQLGAERPGFSPTVDTITEPALSYNVEDLALYLPSRRSRLHSQATSAINAVRRGIVQIAGFSPGGTWIESLTNVGAAPLTIIPSKTSLITNDLVTNSPDGPLWPDEVITGVANGDYINTYQSRTPGSFGFVNTGTTTTNPLVLFPAAIQIAANASLQGTPLWIPAGYFACLITQAINQTGVVQMVLGLPPLGMLGNF